MVDAAIIAKSGELFRGSSIVIGTKSRSTAEEGIVIGRDSRVNSVRGIAQGSNAHATADDATAIGTQSRALSERSQAFGTRAVAQSTNGIAVGYKAQTGQSQNQSQQQDAIAIGTESIARNTSSTALGTSSQATANFAMALGNNSLASAENSTAIGTTAEATGKNSLAFGDNSTASAINSSAIGTNSEATASSAIAFGNEAKSFGVNSTAIGQGATAAQSGNVALGAGSVTEDVHLGKYYINDDTSGFTVAGKTGQGTRTVSVGTKDNERQIQHVAPGVVSAASTDAINGSQLHATNQFANNLGKDTAKIFGGDTTLQSNGKLSDPNFAFKYDDGNKYQNVQDAMSGLQSLGMNFVGDKAGSSVHRDLGQTLNIKGGATGALTDNNISVAVNGADTLDIKLAKDIDLTEDGSLTVGDTVVNDKGLVVNDVTSNPTATTTVTAGKIELFANPTSTAANTIVIDAGTGTIEGLSNRDLDAADFATVGRAATEEQLKLVSDVAQNANQGWNVTTNADATTSENVAPGATVDFDNTDGNIVIAQTGTDLTFDLADDLEIGNSITVGDDVTNQTVINKGSVTTNNLTVTGETRLGDNFVVNNDNSVTYNGAEIANLDDGLNFVGDDGTVVSRKLNQTLGLKGGASGDLTDANIGVVAEVDADGNPTGNMEIKLAKDIDLTEDGSLTVGDTVVNDKGLVVNDVTSNPTATTTVEAGRIELFANPTGTAAHTIVIDASKGTITGLSNKTLDVDGFGTLGRAATEEQLVAYGDELTATGIRFDANTGGVQTAALGSIVAVKGADANEDWNLFDAGENIMTQIVKDNVTGDNVIRVALAKDITSIDTIILGENGTPGKDGKDGAPGIGLDGKDGVIGITGKDGIAGKDGIDGMPGASADITVKQGAPGIDGNDGVDGKTRIVYVKPDGTVEEVATLNDGLYFQGDQAGDGGNVARKLNETLTLSGGESDATKLADDANIGIIKNAAGNGYDFLLAKDLTGLNTIQIGGDTGAPVILGGNADGSLVLNPGGDPAKITNVDQGAINSDSTDAINGSQLQAMGDSLTQFFGEGMEFTNGSFNWENYFTNIFGDNSSINNLADALEPWNAGSGGGNSAPVLPGDNVDISPVAPGSGSGGAGGGTGVGGSGNIVVNLEHDGTDHNYTLDLADNIHVNQSITVGNTEGSYISMGDDGNAGSAGSLNFYGEPDADGNRVSASQTVVAGPGGVGTDQSANDGTRLQYTDGEGNAHTLATLGDGLSFSANDGAQHDAALNTRVDIVGAATNTDWSKFDAGQNIMTQVTTNEDGTGRVTVALSNDLKVESVTATTVNATTVQATTVNATTVNATTVNADSVAINNGGPVINNQGINMNDNRITNVAPGVDGSDAVNVDQLVNVGNHLQNQINDNRNQIRRDRNRANAGIAAAMATAGLPQAYLPGKSMVAVAGGVWRGESGVAIGVSTVSENGKWILKGSANTSGRGGAGGTVGAGYQW